MNTLPALALACLGALAALAGLALRLIGPAHDRRRPPRPPPREALPAPAPTRRRQRRRRKIRDPPWTPPRKPR